ncbi:hypothetical protein SAEN8230_21425 [Salmonella enterica subsp. arizonae]
MNIVSHLVTDNTAVIDQHNTANNSLCIHRYRQRRGLAHISCLILNFYRQGVVAIRPVTVWCKVPPTANLGQRQLLTLTVVCNHHHYLTRIRVDAVNRKTRRFFVGDIVASHTTVIHSIQRDGRRR